MGVVTVCGKWVWSVNVVSWVDRWGLSVGWSGGVVSGVVSGDMVSWFVIGVWSMGVVNGMVSWGSLGYGQWGWSVGVCWSEIKFSRLKQKGVGEPTTVTVKRLVHFQHPLCILCRIIGLKVLQYSACS